MTFCFATMNYEYRAREKFFETEGVGVGGKLKMENSHRGSDFKYYFQTIFS